ncbi:ATP-binding protein [Kitasatospora atroaurantiaca]|uniref:histidine kinase n=1 Tax=Kitasatospora atroaurantiaca TaxID=285545 RepID=A0A561EJ77_9ACTN|nr:ATP-binding protein [Kitasatospora atroaurantiaca]TWE15666.1 signal transduction histidine kinase [Kitasatospora atroaurantiaca]
MGTRITAWWARRSLRLRLSAAAGVVIAAALAGAAVLLVAWLHASLIHHLDQTALQRAQVVAAALETGGVTSSLPASEEGDTAVQVIDSAGAVRASSTNLEGEPRLFTFSAATSGDPQPRTVHGLPLGENGAWRAVAVPAGTTPDPLTVYVAVPTATVDHNLAQLTTGLAVAVPVVVGLLTGVTWLLTGRALRPVDALRAQAAEITASDLGRRLDVPPANDDLGRLATTLNDLLARLDAATRQQRQFVADAAHELRSPLSSLRTQLEVAARHPGSAQWRTLAPDLAEEAERLSRLVDDLVWLARLDARPRLRRRPVDLDEIVFTEVRHARQQTPLVIDESAVGAARVSGDAEALARTVRNLLDNAARHATGRVEVRLAVHDGVAELVVADDGPGIPEADRQRVFERFTRLDTARARNAGGSGLGLAIVHDIVTGHHGSVHIEDNAPGARLVVRLPAH